MDELKKMLKAGDVGEDEEHRAQNEVEKLTHQYVDEVEALEKEKEQELLEV